MSAWAALEAAASELEADRPDPRTRWKTPGELARAVNPAWVQTPALDLLDEALVWLYSARGARLLVSLPPQEGKTTALVQMGSLWALTRDPERRIGIVSYSQSLAENSGRVIRNLITTHDGTDGELDLGLRIARDHGAASRWQIDGYRGGAVAAGVGSGLTGRALDVLLLDDPYADREQAESAYYRERVWEWWRSVGSTRLAPGAPVCVVLTRWHHDDIAGRLVEAEDGHRWRVINIPALADHDPAKGQSDPLGREPGEWLTSARGRTAEEWEQIRIQAGSRTFLSLYQGRPSPDLGDVWKRQWWRRYHEPLWSQHPASPGSYLVHGCDEVIMSWDMAFKGAESAGSDFVVGQVWGRRGANVYLLDQVHKRLSFTETVMAFQAMVARWPNAVRRLVEDKANGPALLDLLRSKVGGIVAVTPKESKYARASAVAPFLEAGNVFLPDKSIALFDPEGLIEESAAFPSAPHDDLVDATSQALAAMLLDSTGAAAWLEWARAKAERAIAEREAAGAQPRGAITASQPADVPALGTGAAPGPAEAEAERPVEGVVVDAVTARKLARDEAYRAQSHGWRW